ncbi:LLM class flavin-dependent oxidoreductase [Lentibacillus cibarius]|uniref:LLM class flavin-dependent oxidoreductase n=1 Tax=Lentibacillus cibarius TaxID=2583219 RepID=A0A549YEZ0_9BACI|nr:LLM class flavin-dependent oxidoreductase [Lentibacillus cibarius]TMN21559.1 LLM class flavin-dependent oxidoreductase [Lentibacillus cibarius]TRM10460.1 LLM class flavin-dependent oxidoreductase [Lentibacillus cibarius]
MRTNTNENDFKLSVLDLATIYNGESVTQTLQNSTELVQLADKLGYTRYWFAEHHNTKHQISTSPDLLAAHAAAVTEHIRIGSGGVMLPNHSPLKVVENFSLLEALHPGRIDLGMGRAPGTDGMTALALRRSREAVNSDQSGELLNELLAYFTGNFPDDHPFGKITPTPDRSLRPELFMLGSSDGGMKMASQLGLGYAFAAQINPDWADPVLQNYRKQFQPSEFLAEPYSILSIVVVCAETDEEAAYYAGPAELQWVRWGTGQFQFAPPTLEEAAAHTYTQEEEMVRQQNKGRFIIGSVDTVKEQILQLKEDAQIDELMVLNMISDKEARNKSFSLLADAFQLTNH